MNDILLTLTPEEMDAALIEGGKKYLALIEAVNEQHKAGEKAIYPNEYHVKAEVICRAQVRKVDTSLFEPWEQKLIASKADATYLYMIQEAREALNHALGFNAELDYFTSQWWRELEKPSVHRDYRPLCAMQRLFKQRANTLKAAGEGK
jgi:hypothetical protein